MVEYFLQMFKNVTSDEAIAGRKIQIQPAGTEVNVGIFLSRPCAYFIDIELECIF